MHETILIVDNGASTHLEATRKALQEKLLHQAFLPCCMEEAVAKALCLLQPPVAVLIEIQPDDVVMGLHVISSIHEARADLPIIALVNYGEEDIALRALKAGAHDFLIKPVPVEKMRLSLQHAVLMQRMKNTIAQLERYAIAHLDALPEEEQAAAMNRLSRLLIDDKGQIKPLKSVEMEIIRFVLHHTNGCMARAARSLGIGRSTLYRKVGEIDMQPYIVRENQTTRPTINVSSRVRSSAG